MTGMPKPEAIRISNVREGLETPLSRFGVAHVVRLEASGTDDQLPTQAEISGERNRIPERAIELGMAALPRLEAMA